MERLAQNLYLAPPTLSQAAALAAFDATDELDEHARRHARNRRLLIEVLAESGVTDIAPADGAFYVWADMSRLGRLPRSCAARGSTRSVWPPPPGSTSTRSGGDRFVRFSVAGSTEEIDEAADRLRTWLASEPAQRAVIRR